MGTFGVCFINIPVSYHPTWRLPDCGEVGDDLKSRKIRGTGDLFGGRGDKDERGRVNQGPCCTIPGTIPAAGRHYRMVGYESISTVTYCQNRSREFNDS